MADARRKGSACMEGFQAPIPASGERMPGLRFCANVLFPLALAPVQPKGLRPTAAAVWACCLLALSGTSQQRQSEMVHRIRLEAFHCPSVPAVAFGAQSKAAFLLPETVESFATDSMTALRFPEPLTRLCKTLFRPSSVNDGSLCASKPPRPNEEGRAHGHGSNRRGRRK